VCALSKEEGREEVGGDGGTGREGEKEEKEENREKVVKERGWGERSREGEVGRK